MPTPRRRFPRRRRRGLRPGFDAVIISQTPVRISFLGGGTDFPDFYMENGGAVLSTAIDKYVFVVLKERFDDLIYVNYSKKEIVSEVSQLKHELIREAMRLTGVCRGVEITTLADIPSEGSGLGSSSSITVGLLQALHAYQGVVKSAEELAREACQIELDILGKPIGKQDQYIAAYGNIRFITFSSDGIRVESVHLGEEAKRRLNQNLILFFTGRTRSADTILVEQRQNIDSRLEELRHMKSLAAKARQCLLDGAWDDFGCLLDEGWEYKKCLAGGITDPNLDGMYAAARKAGALGGKVTGAGGGGFLLLYCPPKRQDEVRAAMKHLRELPFRLERDGSKVIFNIRR